MVGTSAFGRVVAVPGGVWFEPPLFTSPVGYAPGSEPAPRPSGRGVPARGVNLARLRRRPAWSVPPCPAPARGWPVREADVGDGLDAAVLELAETGMIVQRTMFRPPGAAPVLVVAAVDPELVERRLRRPLVCPRSVSSAMILLGWG